jgi:ABC-2 type transport system ATP-binding protein
MPLGSGARSVLGMTIEACGLSKSYGDAIAVDRLDLRVTPGHVTGFLGPNGVGKSTTMRMIVGLTRPTAGEVTVDGRRYRGRVWPLHEVGALLDARAVHPGRSARQHLRSLAAANGIGKRRVDEVLGTVGLASVAGKRVGGFSLGMCQRLGIAAALLGDPGVLLFDEPVNGLDPDGIVWIRDLMRSLAAEGRTLLVSSHLMSEMALTADHLLVIGRGRLIADASLADLIRQESGDRVRVRTAAPEVLAALLGAHGAQVRNDGGALVVGGMGAARIGEVAAAHQIALHQLTDLKASLEEAYFRLTEDSVDYAAPQPKENAAWQH